MKYNGVIGFAIFFAIWSLISHLGIINSLFIASPESSVEKLVTMLVSGNLLPDISITLGRMFLGLAIGAAIGIPSGILFGASKKLYDLCFPLIDAIRSVPATALFVLFILAFGIEFGKVAVVVFGTSLLIVVNAMYGVQHSSKTRIALAKTFGASQTVIFRKIIFFEALPHIFVGLRLAISLSLVLVIVTEMFLGTTLGLGVRIFNAGELYNTSEMYGEIILTGVIGYSLNKATSYFEKRFVHWAGK